MSEVKRPSVAMWSHDKNKWYTEDMYGNIEWFDNRGSDADHNANINFMNYADYLQSELLRLRVIIGGLECDWTRTTPCKEPCNPKWEIENKCQALIQL